MSKAIEELYYTVRSERYRAWLDALEKRELVIEWRRYPLKHRRLYQTAIPFAQDHPDYPELLEAAKAYHDAAQRHEDVKENGDE